METRRNHFIQVAQVRPFIIFHIFFPARWLRMQLVIQEHKKATSNQGRLKELFALQIFRFWSADIRSRAARENINCFKDAIDQWIENGL